MMWELKSSPQFRTDLGVRLQNCRFGIGGRSPN